MQGSQQNKFIDHEVTYRSYINIRKSVGIENLKEH